MGTLPQLSPRSRRLSEDTLTPVRDSMSSRVMFLSFMCFFSLSAMPRSRYAAGGECLLMPRSGHLPPGEACPIGSWWRWSLEYLGSGRFGSGLSAGGGLVTGGQ